jgi:signal transduction histidine kinase
VVSEVGRKLTVDRDVSRKLMGAAMLNHVSRKRKREQEEYEQFIAHEIHDGACQYAVAAQMAFDTFRRENVEAKADCWSSFGMGLEFLDHTIEELRRLVRGLQPIHLAAGGLPTAIACLIKEIQTAGGPDMEFRHDIHSDQIPPQLQRAAFRIVQESLANACRHSKSKRLFVELTLDGDVLRIQVRDWGVGFDPDSTPPGHFGLNGIRRRVELLGGAATIHSKPGKGTCVSVEIPLVP